MRPVHEIDLMKKVVVGRGVRSKLPEVLKELGNYKEVAIVSGPHVASTWGKEIKEILEDGGFDVHIVIVRRPTKDDAEAAYEEVKTTGSDVVVGVGGGKAIDAAKYVAHKLNLDVVSFPTAASHDGIASPFSSLRGMNGPTSVKTVAPIAIVADTEVIVKAPRELNLAGVGDLLGKFSAVKDWRLAHKLKGEYYGSYAASLSLMSAKHVLKYLTALKRMDEMGVRILVEGLISSGVAMCIAGSSRPASGSEHLFSHALDIVANYPARHGEQVAIGSVMMLYLYDSKYWKKVRKAIEVLGLPRNAKELGVSEDKIIEALLIAHKIRPERYTILGEEGLTREAAENLARRTGVIGDEPEE
ncbi:glycerol-1-phosphate dehydrogenase [Ignicoccus islandicus DSM 13165]|uniref:Glycerol-1-phosphate dehydrogenase [NAD(P)+] n=1 Tax=Ignicoccus islandicus DSM 13165 TaxID=940295 RepID=A0A0U2WKF4_9CREN|nr:NAD(P)-dependent glycerol-1-phosphate dehydrogenase [Ignicoccus islandicus]ALU11425.1 glycerol-1-phosphate dehydrogenase [Ignicoccus islandicus DSM 13165]